MFSQRDFPTAQMSQRAQEVQPFRAMVFGEKADEMNAAGDDVIKLCLGEPDFGAPPRVRAEMRNLMDGRSLPYTAARGLPQLRRAISKFYADRHDIDVSPSRIIVTMGGSAALLLAIAATVNPGDEVIAADPSYPCNRELVNSFGGRIVDVPTSVATRYHLDETLIAQAWSERTKAVMITSPSNPTGTSIPFPTLDEVCRYTHSHGAWTIVDETYLDLADTAADGTKVRSVLSCDLRAITVNSFSKYFGMTGWRLGWAVVPEELVPAVDRLATNYFLCAPTPVQYAALQCFTPESYAFADSNREEFRARRELVVEGLDHIGLPVPVTPDGAFYAYFDVSSTGLDAWTFCERALAEAHVALTPGRDFGETTSKTHVRLSYAANREKLAEALRRLGTFVKTL